MAETHFSQLHVQGALAVDGAITATGGLGALSSTGAISNTGGTLATTGALTLAGGTINAGGTLTIAGPVQASGTLHTFGTQKLGWASTPPLNATGWYIGNIIYNTAPAAGGPVGWACTDPTPTWKAFGTLAA